MEQLPETTLTDVHVFYTPLVDEREISPGGSMMFEPLEKYDSPFEADNPATSFRFTLFTNDYAVYTNLVNDVNVIVFNDKFTVYIQPHVDCWNLEDKGFGYPTGYLMVTDPKTFIRHRYYFKLVFSGDVDEDYDLAFIESMIKTAIESTITSIDVLSTMCLSALVNSTLVLSPLNRCLEEPMCKSMGVTFIDDRLAEITLEPGVWIELTENKQITEQKKNTWRPVMYPFNRLTETFVRGNTEYTATLRTLDVEYKQPINLKETVEKRFFDT